MQAPPIIVKLIEPKKDPTGGLGRVFVDALGLTGAIVVAALVCAAVLAAVLFWHRSRSRQ